MFSHTYETLFLYKGMSKSRIYDMHIVGAFNEKLQMDGLFHYCNLKHLYKTNTNKINR